MTKERMQVLIVDDDADFGELTQRRLRSIDADVVFHEGPEGAIERIGEGGFALVLLDINMPGLSGLQILDALKQRGDADKVVLFSSMDERALEEIAKTAGVDYLSKSASKDELLARVAAATGA